MSDADVPPASPFERDWKNLTSQQQAMFRKVVLEAFVPDLMAPAARLGRGGIRHSGGTMSRMGTSPQARDPDVQVAIISGVATDPEGFGHLVKSALIYGDRITITDPAMLALVFAVQFRDGDLDQLPPPLRRAAERAAKVDLGFLVAAREQNLLELNMFMNSTTLAQGSGLDAYWKAIAERLTQKDTYALFDETGISDPLAITHRHGRRSKHLRDIRRHAHPLDWRHYPWTQVGRSGTSRTGRRCFRQANATPTRAPPAGREAAGAEAFAASTRS